MKKLFVLMLLMLMTVGCNAEQIAKLRSGINVIRGDRDIIEQMVMEAEIQRIQLTKAIPDLEGREKALAIEMAEKLDLVITTANDKLIVADKTLEILQKELADAQDGLDVLIATLNTTAQSVPAPYGLFAGLAATVLVGIRAARNRQAARQIASSVDGLLTDEQKATIKGQNDKAKRIVDEAQGTKRIWPI